MLNAMPHDQFLILSAMAYLLVKHAVADYLLQTPYMFRNKGRYLHPGGIIHAALHGILSAPVFLILPPQTLVFGAWIVALEFLLHYHVDWLKERLCRIGQLDPKMGRFWRLHGIDQLVHALTYVAIVAVLLMYSGPGLM